MDIPQACILDYGRKRILVMLGKFHRILIPGKWHSHNQLWRAALTHAAMRPVTAGEASSVSVTARIYRSSDETTRLGPRRGTRERRSQRSQVIASVCCGCDNFTINACVPYWRRVAMCKFCFLFFERLGLQHDKMKTRICWWLRSDEELRPNRGRVQYYGWTTFSFVSHKPSKLSEYILTRPEP